MTDAATAVAIEALTFTYAGAEQPALRDVSLQVRRGEMLVVMGHTGAGKSTLAKCLNRTVPAFQAGELRGVVRIQGEALDGCQVADLAGRVGLVLQDFEAQLFATDVTQELAFGLEQLGVPPPEIGARIAAALARAGLSGFADRDPATLSGGEKQRLAIAAVLAMRPPIMVLDEPTTNLDPIGKREVFDVLAGMRRDGHTMVLIEHEIEAAALADRVALMAEGEVVACGPPEAILGDLPLLQRCGVRPPDRVRLAALGVDVEAVGPAAPAEVVGPAAPAEGVGPAAPAEVVGPAAPAEPPRAPLLRVEAASFSYPDGHAVLYDIELTVRAGEFVALIGQNGSGKSTLAKLLNGLLLPVRGHVVLEGDDLADLPLVRVASRVGYVFQDPDQQLFAATVAEEVAFGPRNLGVSGTELTTRVAEALSAVGLTGLEDEDPFLLGKGQRQRLAVAALLAQRPHLLILDEPTTGLDFAEQTRMMDLVARLHRSGMALVVITHSPWVVAEYAERGVLLIDGRIAFDGPLRALFARTDLLARARFRVPEVTEIGRRLGISALSVEELASALKRR